MGGAWQLFKLQALVRQMLAENGMSPDECATAFREFDADNNGLVEVNEFRHFVDAVLGLKLRKPEFSALWRMLDTDGSGAINFAEFAAVLFPNLDVSDLESEEQKLDELVAATSHGPAGSRGGRGGDGGRCSGGGGGGGGVFVAANWPGALGMNGSPLPARGPSCSFGPGRLSPDSFKRSPTQPPPASKNAALSLEIRTVGLALSARQDEAEARLTKIEELLRDVHARLLEGGGGHSTAHSRHRSKRAHSSTLAATDAAPGGGAGADGYDSATSTHASTPAAATPSHAPLSHGWGDRQQPVTADGGREDSFVASHSFAVSKSAPPRHTEATPPHAGGRRRERAGSGGLTLQDMGQLVVSGFGRESRGLQA